MLKVENLQDQNTERKEHKMRGRAAKKRPVPTDPIYKSKVVTRMINTVMLDGKKSYSTGNCLHYTWKIK